MRVITVSPLAPPDLMRLGYNTNGLAHHNLLDAIRLLAEVGYGSVAITLDHNALNPWDVHLPQQVVAVRRCLEREGMRCVIETGARYLLDYRTKHEPTLLTGNPDARRRRIEFLCRAIDLAAELSSDCVSLWSGALHEPLDPGAAQSRLLDGLAEVVAHAERNHVTLGFEPEPGMLIDRMDRFAELQRQLPSDRLRLTLDVGHLHCLGETPIADVIDRWQAQLVNIHLEDMRAGVHEHLMFGEGEMDFPPLLRALAEAQYRGGVHVELSRHSHDGPRVARRAFEFLQPLLRADCGGQG